MIIDVKKKNTREYNWLEKLNIDKKGLLELQGYSFSQETNIGHGKFANVFKAIEQKTNQVYAIKIMKIDTDQLKKMVLNQAEIISDLDHKNIIKLKQPVKKSGRTYYFVTDFCEQGDLKQILKKRQKVPFTEEQAYPIIRDILSGIVHRDLKPANILMKNGQAKIGDFGLAKKIKQNFKDIEAGTTSYMSPEGLIKNVYGPKTEVWAFGTIIYELLHGQNYFSQFLDRLQLQNRLSVSFKKKRINSDLSQRIKHIILSCLQIKEQKRCTIKQLSEMKQMKELIKQANKTQNSKQVLYEINSNTSKQKSNVNQSFNFQMNSQCKNKNNYSFKFSKNQPQVIKQPQVNIDYPIISKNINVKTLCTFHEYCCLLDRIITQNQIPQYNKLLEKWLCTVAKTLGNLYEDNLIQINEDKPHDRQLVKMLVHQGTKFNKWIKLCTEEQLQNKPQTEEIITKLRQISQQIADIMNKDIMNEIVLTGCCVTIALYCTKLIGKCSKNKKYEQLENYRQAEKMAAERKQKLKYQRYKEECKRLKDYF